MNTKTLDLTPMKWVQEKNAIEVRNEKARAYSESVRQKTTRYSEIKETIGMFLGGLSVFAILLSMYFIGIVFM